MTNTTSLGRQAELKVAQKLKTEGFEILEHNWRTRWCEIDVVAKRGSTVYMVEVKYRINTKQGEPLEYVTASKLKQMSLAAAAWAQTHNFEGDMQLVAASVVGPDFKIGELIFLD